jgi:DMSO reductase anchor subunit
VLATLLGLVTRGASLVRNRRLKYKSSLQTAIGVRHMRIEQKAQGAMGGSFNTREFFHGRSRAAMKIIKYAFLLLVFVLPVLLLGAAYGLHSTLLPVIAFVVQYLGLLAERFYFFADARHPQNLYYQYIS